MLRKVLNREGKARRNRRWKTKYVVGSEAYFVGKP